MGLARAGCSVKLSAVFVTLHGRLAAFWVGAFAATLAAASTARARPNTHAPAVSTWDPRASSVVAGLGQAMTGSGSFSFASYSANFSSTNGLLSAQFGLHYTTMRNADDDPLARGVSAGGVALFSVPLSSLFDNGVPRTSFAFYVGGVPTAMFSGELNFISVPLVLGVGLPYSPSPYFTFRPWAELSPGFNFDTRIQAVVTEDAIQSAMDGTLTREEVEDLVEQGLDIQRQTTVGKRAGLSVSAHLGERVDLDVNLMLGAGQGGALGLGAALVVRWDAMVGDYRRRPAGEPEQDCVALAARYHRSCPLARARARGRAPASKARRPELAPRRAPAGASERGGAPTRPAPPATKSPARAAPPAPPPATPAPPRRADELPPLQAAPPRPL